jgi:hypothetical protein
MRQSELNGISDEQALVLGLDVFTRRDLKAQPPKDSETIQQIGIGPNTLNTAVRRWLNRRFRDPKKKPRLLSGKLTSSTTFAALKKAVFG